MPRDIRGMARGAVESVKERLRRPRKPKDYLTFTNFFRLAWMILIWRYEYLVFNGAIDACQWDKWEQWVRTRKDTLKKRHDLANGAL